MSSKGRERDEEIQEFAGIVFNSTIEIESFRREPGCILFLRLPQRISPRELKRKKEERERERVLEV